MKRSIALLAAIVLVTAGSTAYGLYSVADTGRWPKSWPAELEPLRKQSRTLVGPILDFQHFEVPFAKRDEFEAAWPQLLKVKTPEAPVILRKRPSSPVFAVKAGVVIHSPPLGTNKQANPEAPLRSTNVHGRWMWTTYIELIVDGDIVDLNRIPLPVDTPIIDERFLDDENRASQTTGK